MAEDIAIGIAILTAAFLLPGAAAMVSLSNSSFLRYLRSAHHATWLQIGPHPPSGRNNISAFFKFVSLATPPDIPDKQLRRLAKNVSRWLFVLLSTVVLLLISAGAALVLP